MILVEAAIDSPGDAARAVAEGARRLEVCARLDEGGLTPAPDVLRACLRLGVPCMAMVRPRGGDFIYDESDLARLRADAAAVCEAGAQGLVFGVLAPNGRVDERIARELAARHAGRELVFHRAFDRCRDPREALESLVSCGVARVLTSGHAGDAMAGATMLASLVRQSAGRIEVLAGGGVRASNAGAVVHTTGVTQVHARATEPGIIAGIVDALAHLV